AEFLSQGETFGAIAAGHRADLLLVTGNPLEDVANLRRREGVMLRGVWHAASELDAQLERRAERVALNPSAFDGVAEPAADGTRELSARYQFSNGGIAIAEQRLFIDKRPDGTRVAFG